MRRIWKTWGAAGRIAALSFSLAWSIPAAQAESCGDRWELRHPPQRANTFQATLRSIVSGGGIWVAVGENQAILSSANGKEWTERLKPRKNASGADSDLNAVAFGAGRFVAVGACGRILTSRDGSAWSSQRLWTTGCEARRTKNGDLIPPAPGLRDVAWNGSRFLAVGERNTLLTSADGLVWISRRIDAANDLGLGGIAFGAGRWVVAGSEMVSSTDGRDWTRHSLGSTPVLLARVAWNGKSFAAAGSGGVTATSADGNVWTLQNPAKNALRGTVLGLAANDQRWVALLANGVRMISEDGIRWTVGDAGMNVPLYGLTWTNGMFIAVGKEVLTSPDGENWTPQAWDAGLSLNGVAWNGSDYVAVGDEILTSADGITWIAAKPMADRPAGSMRDVLWNGEQFLAVGDSGTVITSPDGENWTVRSPAPADEPERAPSTESIPDAVSSLAHLTAVAWRGPQAGSPGRFVAVGTDSAGGAAVPVWTSPDGLAWTPGDFGSALPFATANGVASNGQRYVAVGVANDLPSNRSRRRGARKGFVSDSADGVSWGARNSGELGMPNGIAWDGGAYLAVGENGRIAGSLDGSLWSAMHSGTSKTLRRIAAANGNLVAVGDRGTILRSPSGAKWRKSASKSRSDLRGVAFTGNRWIAVGTGMTVLSSACNQR